MRRTGLNSNPVKTFPEYARKKKIDGKLELKVCPITGESIL